MGRTEQFTEVTFETDHPESQIITAKIIGIRENRLTA
jgi:threonylcarbamoyladenosine tRNA methylthiotransferase MtaB